MGYERKLEACTIVLISDFNPLTYDPNWFLRSGIISEVDFDTIQHDAETAITANHSHFKTANLTFHIDSNRIQIMEKKEPFELLVDIMEKLKENLSSIQIKAFGMNYSFHIALKNKTEMRKFGDAIAPKELWKPLFDDIGNDNEEKTSGLSTITMTKITEYGQINLQVESSVPLSPTGIYFSYNYHHENDDKKPIDIDSVNDIVRSKFDEYHNYSIMISDNLINRSLQ